MSTAAKRYPADIMGTCVVPWTESYAFDETKFRAQVRDLAENLTPHLYVFGTAGEGYAVTDAQYEAITRSFLEEAAASGARPTVGLISLSLPVILERIEKAIGWGAKSFQISLPSWAALNDRELETFFRETCGRFREVQFLHYNLLRTKRLITPVEYGRLAAEHPNFIATKNTKDDEAFLTELLTEAPQLQHFLGESGYARMRGRFECGLLISIASTNAKRARKFFDARGEELAVLRGELQQGLAAIKEVIGPEPLIDGAYDKLLYKITAPDFPLRLLPPYESADEATALPRYREALSRLAPMWLPE
jgi:dihydrodipicolinate synthase/N-acetylneuraminate lyase